jgi:hypothetical protein
MPKNMPKIQIAEYQLYIDLYICYNVKILDSEVNENITLQNLMNKRCGKSVIVPA